MNKLYEKYEIGNLKIENRIVSSAMFEYAAENGKISDRIINHYENLAKGGSGLIITGMQSISDGAGYGPTMVKTSYPNYIEDMKKISDVVHKHNSLLFVQLQHVGYKTNWRLGYDKIGVSDFINSEGCLYKEATEDDIKKIINDFAISAKKCKDAGCDGVQIHAAHGFLINTFLSSHFNRRNDIYGGDIKNRARILFEIYEAIRSSVGENFPISVKIPFSDLVDDGNTMEEMIYVCKELESMGVDMLEISSGITMDGGKSSFSPFITSNEEGKFLESAKIVSDILNIPIVSVCGYRSPKFIEKVLSETNIAAISLGRPLTCEPDLPNRWKYDSSPAKCISCNRCYKSKDIISCQIM